MCGCSSAYSNYCSVECSNCSSFSIWGKDTAGNRKPLGQTKLGSILKESGGVAEIIGSAIKRPASITNTSSTTSISSPNPNPLGNFNYLIYAGMAFLALITVVLLLKK